MLLSRWILTVSILLFDGICNVALASDFEDEMSDEGWDGDDDDDDGLEACPGDDCEVIVVGCGLAGLFATARLQKEDRHTILLESDEICGGRFRSWDLEYEDGSKLRVEKVASEMLRTEKGNSDRENPIHRLLRGYGFGFAYFDYRDLVSFGRMEPRLIKAKLRMLLTPSFRAKKDA